MHHNESSVHSTKKLMNFFFKKTVLGIKFRALHMLHKHVLMYTAIHSKSNEPNFKVHMRKRKEYLGTSS
jgi:hypothetical protein